MLRRYETSCCVQKTLGLRHIFGIYSVLSRIHSHHNVFVFHYVRRLHLRDEFLGSSDSLHNLRCFCICCVSVSALRNRLFCSKEIGFLAFILNTFCVFTCSLTSRRICVSFCANSALV